MVLQKIWRARWSWLPGLLLVTVVLIGLSYVAGGPSVVFKYIF